METTVLMKLTIYCIAAFTVSPATGYSQGPPWGTCMIMFPKHRMDLTWQKSGPCPYKIKFSPPSYRPLQNITVTIEADDGRQLMGIQISAHRKLVNTEEFVGTFVSLSPQDKLQVFSCAGGRHNQVGHKNNIGVEKVELIWQAPKENIGDVTFKATFVQNYSTFWAWQTEDLKTYDQNSIQRPANVVETPTLGMGDIDFTECGSDKGCLFYPRYCSGSDCDAALTYQKAGEDYIFEMVAKSPGYVTMGLSKDKTMGGDGTITCTIRGNITTIQNGFNPAYYNERVLVHNLTNQSVKQTTNHVMCRFTRPRVLGVLQVMANTDPPEMKTLNFDLNEPWYLMMSWGHLPYGTDVMGTHTELPVVSDSFIDFKKYGIHRGSSLPREYQAHGSLMVVAWILLTGLATVIAGHYKDMCVGHTFLGTKVWFQAHRALAVSVLLFTAASFTIIFVKLQDLSQTAGAVHAKVGIAVGVAVLLQVFGGLLRPKPDSDIRPFFRWGHRFLGHATHILAAVNLYLAFNIMYMPNSMKHYGTITILVWVGVQVVWEVVFECWSCRKTSSQGGGTISDPKGLSMEEDKKIPSARSDKILMVLYFLTLVTFAVAALCGIFMF